MNSQRSNRQNRRHEDSPSGRVRFDERGNAIWETWRGRLEHPALAIVDDDPPSRGGMSRINRKGGRLGYNPYDSGLVMKRPEDRPRKKDLRALSRWIQLQKSRKRNEADT